MKVPAEREIVNYKISAFYGAKAFRVGESVNQTPDMLPNKTPVEVIAFSAGILPGNDSGDNVIVKTADGLQYVVKASQVVDA